MAILMFSMDPSMYSNSYLMSASFYAVLNDELRKLQLVESQEYTAERYAEKRDHSLLARFHVVVSVGTPRLPKVRRSSLSCSDGARCKRIDIFVRCRSEGSMVQLQLDKQVT